MPTTIRLATEDDAPYILELYTPIVQETTISFELTVPAVEEIQERIRQSVPRFPWLVCENETTFMGYAYASAYRSRLAYQWSVDVSVYVNPACHRNGVGRALYTSLFKILAAQGFYNAFAIVALPNPASIGLHQSLGFEHVGEFQRVGYKLGEWRDVSWWQLSLQSPKDNPRPARSLSEFQDTPEWQAAIDAGLSLLRDSE